MRVFVSFGESVHCLDVDVEETVHDIKNKLRERFGLNLKNPRSEADSFVSLVYQGSRLQDSWMYSDLGIPPGSTLCCRVEKQEETSLRVHCENYDETVVFKQVLDVWSTTVGTLRGMIQDSTGMHVSAFRLYSSTGLELFDCHPLKVYKIDAGDTVTMAIWRDVADVLQAARENEITDSIRSLASPQDSPHLLQYQLQLSLFTAAHYGYHQLATQLMKYGARPDEPVGQHPSRDWCRASAHVDHEKTPAHEAAQHGRLKCLQHFLMFNYAVLICKDAHGLTPCNIARRYKQTECFKLLVAEQFRIPRVHPELSIQVYARVRKWCDRARHRARFQKDKTAVLLLANAEVSQKRAVVGQKVEVDGFGSSERMVKSAPSSLDIRNDKIPPNPKSNNSANGRSRGKVVSNPSLKPSQDLFSVFEKAMSDLRKGKDDNDLPKSSLRESSNADKCSRHENHKPPNSNAKQNNRELFGKTKALSPGVANSTTRLKDTAQSMYQSPSSTHGYRTPLKSAATACVSREGNPEGKREPPPFTSRNETGKSPSRYVWKLLDDKFRENEHDDGDVLSISGDIRGQTVTSNDTHSYPVSGEISEKWHRSEEIQWKANDRNKNIERCKIEQAMKRRPVASPCNKSLTTISKIEQPVLNRGKIGTGRCSSSVNKQLPNENTRDAALSPKEAPSPQASPVVQGLQQHHGPLKRRSAQSMNIVFQSSVDSTADQCLRVACETYRKKSWLGQLQMALVVNTNMCRRRLNVPLKHRGDL